MRVTVLTPPALTDERAPDPGVPRESVTRLRTAFREPATLESERTPSLIDAHPTTPVPSFYLLLPMRADDDVTLGALAGRLEDLGDDTYELLDDSALDEPANDPFDEPPDDPYEEPVTDPFVEVTRMRTVVPPRDPSTIPPPMGCNMFTLLASTSRIPYLRRSPRDIPKESIDLCHAQVLALIDGHTSIDQLLAVAPLAATRVLEVVSDLIATGVIGLHG